MESEGELESYFAALKSKSEHMYSIAEAARAKMLDPQPFVEIIPTKDVAERVEGIVGPKGIGALIKKLEAEGKGRDIIAHEIVKKIITREFDCKIDDKAKLIEQAVRTGVGILTEGVLVAPTEGIEKVEINQNPDGSDYVSIFFAGPIRSAGGTIAALAVVLADVARMHFGIGNYRPTDTECERYLEEITLYDARKARLQYKPTDNEIKYLVKNCPVCVDGAPTEEFEVSAYRDLPRIKSNFVRGGIGLVLCEGVAQKAAKVLKYTKKIGLDWSWLEPLIKVGKKEGAGGYELKPNDKYLDDIVAGRPIFSYPMRAGGFRLRYGRCRDSGIMGKAIHPATMYIVNSFLAIGTQMKVERPGKGCVVAPCTTILGPVVKLKDGSVVDVNASKLAQEILPQVEEILFLGDLLVSFGDFSKANHPLVPGAWCEEWFEKIAKKKNLNVKHNMSAGEAIKFSRQHGIALHPKYTYFWHDIKSAQLKELAQWLCNARLHAGILKLDYVTVEHSPAKRVLELLCIPHKIEKGNIRIDGETAFALLKSLGILVDAKLTMSHFDAVFDAQKSALENVKSLSGIEIMPKSPTYVGSRMARPEKAKERAMKPPVHTIFPLGMAEKNRSIVKLYGKMKDQQRTEGSGIEVEISRMQCRSCGKIIFSTKCGCGGMARQTFFCFRCNKQSAFETCPVCKSAAKLFDKRSIDLVGAFDEAKVKCGIVSLPNDVKGVKGLMSISKMPENLQKGILRAKHGITIFRDGTCRFDCTDMPLTHFRPKEVDVEVKKLRELGYTHDVYGKPLERGEQVLELKCQDVLLADRGAEFFLKVAAFVDELLVCTYGLAPFYNMKKREDLVGQLVIGLSPHTSAGVLSRIIGFTKARVGYAHPYFHCAKRRNADGDEDTLILMMDGLLNFSKSYLPAGNGGTMDSPLVLTLKIDPSEVDDEAHAMDICADYPLEFYEATMRFASTSDVKLNRVKDVLGTAGQYSGMMFTHDTGDINEGPSITTYVQFEEMEEKVNAQLALENSLRCVDAKDVAERIILSHFLPDLYGNLRSFSRQIFRCIGCNAKYRRVPLVGKCPKCGGKILLTINKGGIKKYLDISMRMVERYSLPEYLKQRLILLHSDIDSVFEDEQQKQVGLSDFM